MTCPRGIFLIAAATTALGCGSGGGFPDAPEIDAPTPPGTFTLDWSVTDTNDNAISCDSIGAQIGDRADAQPRGRGRRRPRCSPARPLEGTSQTLIPGTYDIDFELVGSGGPQPSGVIATAPAQLGIEIKSGENVRAGPADVHGRRDRRPRPQRLDQHGRGNCAPDGRVAPASRR